MVASTLLLDSPLTVWTRLGGASNLFYVLDCSRIFVVYRIEFNTSQTFVPLALVCEAYLCSATRAFDPRLLRQVM